MNNREITIPQETVGERIDAYLASELDMSRSSIVSMLENGEILVNDKIVKKNVGFCLGLGNVSFLDSVCFCGRG